MIIAASGWRPWPRAHRRRKMAATGATLAWIPLAGGARSRRALAAARGRPAIDPRGPARSPTKNRRPTDQGRDTGQINGAAGYRKRRQSASEVSQTAGSDLARPEAWTQGLWSA